LTGRGHILVTLVASAGVLATIFQPRPVSPLLVWNPSESAPVGLYAVHRGQALVRGDYVLLAISPCWRDFAAARGYLPPDIPLLKPVAALVGDKVCRVGRRITINDKAVANAHPMDRKHRPMPHWNGCRVLARDEIFILGSHPASFDSRYFGVISADGILGRAQKLF